MIKVLRYQIVVQRFNVPDVYVKALRKIAGNYETETIQHPLALELFQQLYDNGVLDELGFDDVYTFLDGGSRNDIDEAIAEWIKGKERNK